VTAANRFRRKAQAIGLWTVNLISRPPVSHILGYARVSTDDKTSPVRERASNPPERSACCGRDLRQNRRSTVPRRPSRRPAFDQEKLNAGLMLVKGGNSKPT
jgi:hypothetical protein